MVTSNWDGVNARDEIFNFVDRINNQLTRRNDFDKDFVMKSCLVLTGLPVAYKVQNFNNANLTTIRQNWHVIKKAVKRGVDLINSFGVDRDNLTSTNAVIPIIYFMFKNPDTALRGSTPFEATNADLIRRWLIAALLKGAFGRASDNLLKDIRSNIDSLSNPGADFPVDAISLTFAKTGLAVGFDDYAVEDVLDLRYGGQQTFLALSLLYDDAGWGTMQFHQDHIFARGLFKPRELSSQNRLEWNSSKERIGNLCLLLATENIGKQDMPVADWLETREPGFLKRHLIPPDRSLWNFDRFPDFLKARETLIRGRLQTLFGAKAKISDSDGD